MHTGVCPCLPSWLFPGQRRQKWFGCGFDRFSPLSLLAGSGKLGNQGSFVGAAVPVGALQSQQSEINRWSYYLISVDAPITEGFDLQTPT